jgi:hypothetical protein
VGTKDKRVNAPWLEFEFVDRVARDFKDRAFLASMVAEERRIADLIEADSDAIDSDTATCREGAGQRARLAADSSEKLLLEKIEEAQRAIDELRQQKSEWMERAALKQRPLTIDEKEIAFAFQRQWP